MIFLSIRFYVKSILEILEVQHLSYQHIKKAMNFDFDEFLHFLKAEIYQMNKIQSPTAHKAKLTVLETSRFFRVDFT